jgi:WD40 repeat protein
LYTIEEGKLDLEGDSNFVACCCFAPDGSQLLSGSDDTTMKVTTVATDATVTITTTVTRT